MPGSFLLNHENRTNALFVLSTVVVIGRFVLLPWPEVVPFGAELGDLLHDIALAYGAAWVFQLLVVVLPAKQQQKAINAVVAPNVYALVRVGRQHVEQVVLALLERDGVQLLGGDPVAAERARERVDTVEAKLALAADQFATDAITGGPRPSIGSASAGARSSPGGGELPATVAALRRDRQEFTIVRVATCRVGEPMVLIGHGINADPDVVTRRGTTSVQSILSRM